jgi:HlyD family secretion protein
MRRAVIILIVLAVLIAAGWFALGRWRAQQRAAALSDLQTVTLERGDLVATIGATGVVRANQTGLLAWQTTGTIDEVFVEVGQAVSTDEVLADLQESSLPQNILAAAVELVSAQNDLEDLLEPPTTLELTQAEQGIAAAQDALRAAERRLANLRSASPDADIDQAKANLVLAENKLEKAREEFEPYADRPENNLIRATLLSQLAQAQKEYDAAANRLNGLLGMTNPIDLAVAEADFEVAEAQLEEAREHYESLREGPEEDDIAAAQARVAAAQATVDLARLVAPFPGTITEVHNKSGDQVAPGTVAFRLDNLDRMLVDVQVSEVDINRIRPGQEVTLTFDAILGKEYHGVVREVAPVGSAQEGVVDFTITVELADADQDVRPGMTAAVNILVDRLEDVLLVPNRAVRVREGQRVVYILRDGVPTPVQVSLGASSETASQMLEGELEPGDRIVLNPPTEFEQGGPPPFVER